MTTESNTERRVLVEPTAAEATEVAAELFKTAVCDSVGERGKCRLALAGGTTPHALYQLLAEQWPAAEVPWPDVEVFFGDERNVPQDDIESNYGMAQRTLLDHVPVPPHQIHPMSADAEDLDAAAADYEQMIRHIVPAGSDGIPKFDLVLLGMGGDGHTASLFPGTEALHERSRLVVSHFVQVLGRHRMTVTFPLINAGRNVILMVTGDDKAEAVAALLGDDPQRKKRFPAAAVQPAEGKLYLVLDADAARLTDLYP